MKKIFSQKRSKTPAVNGNGPLSEVPSLPTAPYATFSNAASSSLADASGLMRPKPVYGTPSPQTTYSTPATTLAAPSPPVTLDEHGMRLTSPALTPLVIPSSQLPASSAAPQRSTVSNGAMGSGEPQSFVQGEQVIAEADSALQTSEQEAKLSVGIDFGTTFSGVAYGSNRHMSGQVRQILNWPGSYETYRKVPTCIAYYQPTPADEAIVVAWGIEAKAMTLREGFYKVEWFKLFLDPQVLREGRLAASARLPELPYGKQPVDVVTDYLSCLWKYAKERITEEIGSVADLEGADVILTVPAAWDAAGCQIMRTAAINAGMVQSARGGDKNWRERLRIITEPEAAAIHASTLTTLLKLRASQSFIICDAGGGTVDTAAYKLIGQLSQLEIAEMCARTGANCGSLFLDLRFEALVKSLLRNHPVHLDEASLLAFRHAFADCDKLIFRGTLDDDTHFRFNCFNIENAHDPECGLEYGELVIPGAVLKRDVFDPVVQQVLDIIEVQLAKVPTQTVQALILVGGFAASEYLCARVHETFGHRIPIIAKPRDTDVATLQGAARYGLGLIGGKATVSSVISPRSYIMKCKLPATEEDRYQRPGFIVRNNAGVEVCENRLSYLVAKGAVLRKGQRLRSRYCKFSRSPQDSIFTAVLYVSDSDRIYRYTDEDKRLSLSFWCEFDLALQMDSAEIIGLLLTDEGEEVGRATFEFLGTE
ncbi:Hsp70 family protein [Rhodotorula paludigena]|uniref:Hsp70 family protein n=1 Tax=Rhodotorula paludigena TaxID=86838 RepID=UPI0031793792